MRALHLAICLALPASGMGVSFALAQEPVLPLTALEGARYDDLEARALQTMTNVDLADYLSLRRRAFLSVGLVPEPAAELVAVTYKGFDQPYRLSASRFDLAEADCVVFVERAIAMSLSPDWETYHKLCERLRHKDGVVGFKNRNFFTLSDWVPNNAWLLQDITGELAGGRAAQAFTRVVRPKRFVDVPNGSFVRTEFLGADYDSLDKKYVTDTFTPRSRIPDVLAELMPGDVCLVIREYRKEGMRPWYDCVHMALVADVQAGKATIAHCAPPAARMDDVRAFLRTYRFVAGFKFLRLREGAPSLVAAELARMGAAVETPEPVAVDEKVVRLRLERQ